MASTQGAIVHVRLKPATRKRLAKLARASGRSSDFLVTDAVESYVASRERMLADVRQADRQIRAGHHIKHDEMRAWLLSWGTGREIPPPKCVCGKRHDDEALCR